MHQFPDDTTPPTHNPRGQQAPGNAYPPYRPDATTPAEVYAHAGAYPPVAYPPPPEYYQQGIYAQQPGYGAYAPPMPPAYPPQTTGTTSLYPAYAPDGRVDPALLHQSQVGQAPQRRTGGRGAAGVAVGSAIVAVVSKFALVLKFLLPLISALASFAAYALLFGWQFGVGIVVLLFIHEMGHFVVIRAKGLPASLPVFIPLVGAYVAMKRMPSNVRDEAEIAIAGPLAGWVAGVACFALYQQTHIHVLLPLAYFNFFINLINLIPVSPLDGGRVVGAISRWFWPLGLAAIAVGIWFTHSLILIFVAILGVQQMIQGFRASPANRAYYTVPLAARLYVTITYFGLAAALGFSTFLVQHQMALQAGFLR